MTLKEAIEYWEQFNSEIDKLLYRTYGARKKVLEEQREVVEFTIAALREMDSQEKPKTPCDLCLYNPPSSGDGKPCTMCPASSLPEPLGEPAEAKHECDFAKQMGFSTCDKCPIDCDIRQMPKEEHHAE